MDTIKGSKFFTKLNKNKSSLFIYIRFALIYVSLGIKA
jgi:hypothetical protein